MFKKLPVILIVFAIVFISENVYSQDNMTSHLYHTSQGDFLVAPNIIPYPNASIHEMEIPVAVMGGNQNVMYGSWISEGNQFYGTGYIFTSDGGTTWSGNYNNMNMGTNGGYPGPWIWPAGSPWAGRLGVSVLANNMNTVIAFYSTDNGVSWSTPATLGGSQAERNLSCVDDVSGSPFFGRAYTLWTDYSGNYANRIVGAYTSNGGVSWTGYAPVSPPPVANHLCLGCDVCVGPGGVLYAVWADEIVNGSNYLEDSLGFAKSTDGGVTWAVSKNNALPISGIFNRNFSSAQIQVNSFPRIAVDKSGGARNGWIYVTLDEKFTAPALDSADITLCRSTDGGNSWSHTKVNQDPAGSLQWMPSVCVSPNGTVAIDYYDNRGLTNPVSQIYMSMSNSGGNTWSDLLVSDHTFTLIRWYWQSGYYGDHIGITYSNGKFWPFWMDPSVGNHYQIWTAGVTPVGITQNGNEIPNKFELFQNYPNPFNPTTKIKFSVPSNVKSETSNVKLIIYDILGREVATLVNERLQLGMYEVEWDGTNYSSGIYFYTLIAGDASIPLSIAKKMILMK